jgi:hypothetical protein
MEGKKLNRIFIGVRHSTEEAFRSIREDIFPVAIRAGLVAVV